MDDPEARDPAMRGTSGKQPRPKTAPLPAHERYGHYKMNGFAGKGAKTSWAK